MNTFKFQDQRGTVPCKKQNKKNKTINKEDEHVFWTTVLAVETLSLFSCHFFFFRSFCQISSMSVKNGENSNGKHRRRIKIKSILHGTVTGKVCEPLKRKKRGIRASLVTHNITQGPASRGKLYQSWERLWCFSLVQVTSGTYIRRSILTYMWLIREALFCHLSQPLGFYTRNTTATTIIS